MRGRHQQGFIVVNHSSAVWALIGLAALAANLPFVSQRVLGVFALKRSKNLGLRLAELFVFYLLWGALGLWLEQRSGQIAPQEWAFYAVTGCLFITMAFPGFVWRYLLKRHG